jgi:pimeloyl-ACP methyl ester carboxylesterase
VQFGVSSAVTEVANPRAKGKDEAEPAEVTSRPAPAREGARPLRTTEMADGRTVGYYEYGDPNGIPVFALHGTPGCGAGFSWADEAARERAVRLLAPDRPGVGLSTPAELRPVCDYPADLAAFADALDIDQFAVLGYSGGGPFACAAAHRLGDRLRAVGVVSGAGQVGQWATIREANSTDRMFMHLSLRFRPLGSVLLQASSTVARRMPRLAISSAKRELAPPDRLVAARFGDDRELLDMFTEAFMRGTRGVLDDYASISVGWGFAVEEIERPVHIWHGGADVTVPLAHSRALAERLRDPRFTVWPSEGHLAVIEHIGDVLDALVAA